MRYILLVLCFCFVTTEVKSAELSSRDFAAGLYLEVVKKGPLYSVKLPKKVYETVTRADLADIRVFNRDGEVVPHGFRPIAPQPDSSQDQKSVPFFPLYGEDSPSTHGDLSLKVNLNADSTIVDIRSKGEVTEPHKEKVEGYLLDLTGLQSGAAELHFFWQVDGDSSLYSVTMQQSNDLKRWSPFVREVILADMKYGGQRIEKREISVFRKPQKYLRVTWKKTDKPLLLTKVTIRPLSKERNKTRQWVSLRGGITKEQAGLPLFDFESNYHLPATSVQVNFPEKNSIARVTVQSRQDADSKWRERCQKVFYNLEVEGSMVQNDACFFSERSDLFWRMVIQEDGAGLQGGKRLPVLQLGWVANELLFMGRGDGPYLLAFGSGKEAGTTRVTSGDMIQQTLQAEPSSQMMGVVQLGKRVTLAGDEALKAPAASLPWKRWLLWGVLVMGVTLLGYMARSLISEIKKAEEKDV